MIGIEIISHKLHASFGPVLEAFLNEHPKAEILTIYPKGIEGGKGVVAILKYEKKELKPTPKVDTKALEAKKAKAEAKDKMAQAIEEQKIKDLEKISEDQRLLKEKAEKVRDLQAQLEELEV